MTAPREKPPAVQEAWRTIHADMDARRERLEEARTRIHAIVEELEPWQVKVIANGLHWSGYKRSDGTWCSAQEYMRL